MDCLLEPPLPSSPHRVVLWGTYDLGKPRTRILIRGLAEAGVALVQCHVDVWSGIEDKANIAGWRRIAAVIGKLILAYPVLIWRYLRLPRHDVVLVGYLGHLDVIVLWPFAALRGVPVVWDAFLSLYETVVEDRQMVGPRHPLAWLVWAWDWLACRAADLVLLDTHAHAHWFQSEFKLRDGRTDAVFVGAEPDAFAPLPNAGSGTDGPIRVLFYGQFIPLHGIETIVAAAARTAPELYSWTIIGTGQEDARIRTLLDAHPIPHLRWITWVPYAQLRESIATADICLGIFGQSGKAARVIPNKVFQVIAAGRPLVTRDSPAMRELVTADTPGIHLVRAGDADSLLAGIAELARQIRQSSTAALFGSLRERIAPGAIGRQLAALLASVASARQGG
ncbi:MAG TPA: glycosyltransferase [Dongiaceae bacterium]|nr:glycosyltransferase [Dongiaceae bacterium]